MMSSFHIFIVFVLLCIIPSSSLAAPICVTPSSVSFSSSDHVLVNNVRMNLKGVSWFGFEGSNFCVEGLDQRPLESLLDFVSAGGFNAIRLPFSADIIVSAERRFPTNINYALNPTLQGKTSFEVMEIIVQEAGKRGLTIMPDMHLFDPSQGTLQPPLWYSSQCTFDSAQSGDAGSRGLCTAVTPACVTNRDGECVSYTEQVFMDMWSTIVDKFSPYWNFLGVDLINEPHEPAVWGPYGGLTSQEGNSDTDWASAAERITSNILARNTGFRGLVFIEGIGNIRMAETYCHNLTLPGLRDGHWWGGNLEGARCRPLSTTHDNTRIVYAPHQYGPSVYDQTYFKSAEFPDDLPPIWDAHWGSVRASTGKAFVVGEWGGPLTGRTELWLNKFATYMIENDIRDNFHWALNPNPRSDTPGVLLDWSHYNNPKMDLLHRVQPNPTKFTVQGEGANAQVCFEGDVAVPAPNSPPPSQPDSTSSSSTPPPPPSSPSTAAPPDQSSSTNNNPTTTSGSIVAPPTETPPSPSSPSSSSSSSSDDDTDTDVELVAPPQVIQDSSSKAGALISVGLLVTNIILIVCC